MLVLLVVLSLVLLTAYFGEAPGGRLHDVQRGFLTVISPIQDGANKALAPVRNLFGWFDDTLHAKSQRDQLRKQVDVLRRELIADQAQQRFRPGARGVVTSRQAAERELLPAGDRDGCRQIAEHLVRDGDDRPGPVRWGSVNDPVINGEGLVGKVTQAAPDGAQISLITDSTIGVSARIGSGTATGIVQPKVGDPATCSCSTSRPTHRPTSANSVTSGTVAGPDDSCTRRAS